MSLVAPGEVTVPPEDECVDTRTRKKVIYNCIVMNSNNNGMQKNKFKK
jgi:hypothetical protein